LCDLLVDGRLEGNAMELDIKQDGSISLYGELPKIGQAPQLPSYEDAVKIATDWLNAHDLYPPNVTKIVKGGGLTVGQLAKDGSSAA
jgi:hypothetical protein